MKFIFVLTLNDFFAFFFQIKIICFHSDKLCFNLRILFCYLILELFILHLSNKNVRKTVSLSMKQNIIVFIQKSKILLKRCMQLFDTESNCNTRKRRFGIFSAPTMLRRIQNPHKRGYLLMDNQL